MKVQDQDLELAKLKLIEEDLSLVIVKKGKALFETQKQGGSIALNLFLATIEPFPSLLEMLYERGFRNEAYGSVRRNEGI